MLLTLPCLNNSYTLNITMMDARERMRSDLTAPFALAPFTPNQVLLTFITDGTNTITRRDESVILQPGDAIMLWPAEEVRAVLSATRLFRAINVVFEMPDEAPRTQIFPEVVRASEDSSELRRAMEACALCAASGRAPLAQIEFTAILIALSRLLLLRREATLSPAVRRALDLVRRRPENPPSRDELAAVANVSPSHLSHMVKRETGTTLSLHIQAARIARARELMHQSNFNIGEIARTLDMDLPRFSRLFKQVTGASPREYARTARLDAFGDNAQSDK